MRWQQPLQAGPVVSGNAHRSVEREAAVVPPEHVVGGLGVEQPAAGEPTQHPAAYLLGDGAEVLRCRCPRRTESHPIRADGTLVEALEDAVEDAAVVMDVAVER